MVPSPVPELAASSLLACPSSSLTPPPHRSSNQNLQRPTSRHFQWSSANITGREPTDHHSSSSTFDLCHHHQPPSAKPALNNVQLRQFKDAGRVSSTMNLPNPELRRQVIAIYKGKSVPKPLPPPPLPRGSSTTTILTYNAAQKTFSSSAASTPWATATSARAYTRHL